MINLEKKKTLNLSKAAPSLNDIKVGLSWDEVILNGKSPDADASIFMLGNNGKLISDDYFVFYNNLSSIDGSVNHLGDNRTGQGDGDDEIINVSLSKVNSEVIQILVVITIHNIDEGFHFGNIKNSSVRIYNQANNQIMCEYKLTDDFNGCDSLIIGRLYRNSNEWEFEAMGHAISGGLNATYEYYSN
jgi:tellurium resistance protein TerD